jgi:hypothetical protein
MEGRLKFEIRNQKFETRFPGGNFNTGSSRCGGFKSFRFDRFYRNEDGRSAGNQKFEGFGPAEAGRVFVETFICDSGFEFDRVFRLKDGRSISLRSVLISNFEFIHFRTGREP